MTSVPSNSWSSGAGDHVAAAVGRAPEAGVPVEQLWAEAAAGDERAVPAAREGRDPFPLVRAAQDADVVPLPCGAVGRRPHGGASTRATRSHEPIGRRRHGHREGRFVARRVRHLDQRPVLGVVGHPGDGPPRIGTHEADRDPAPAAEGDVLHDRLAREVAGMAGRARTGGAAWRGALDGERIGGAGDVVGGGPREAGDRRAGRRGRRRRGGRSGRGGRPDADRRRGGRDARAKGSRGGRRGGRAARGDEQDERQREPGAEDARGGAAGRSGRHVPSVPRMRPMGRLSPGAAGRRPRWWQG